MARGSAARSDEASAKQPRTKLTAVKNDPPPGDYDLTREAMAGWTKGQRVCRARKRHNWGPHTVYAHATFYDVVERCTHCSNRRHAPYSRQGRKLDKWKPDYRDGYLLPKGAARLDEDTHDELVLADLLSRKTVTVQDEE